MTTLVVTDLDASLWGKSMECHADTLAALATLRRRDIPVLVATGRREASTRFGFGKNNLSYPAVVLNGAVGVDIPTGHHFHEHGFTHEEVQMVLSALAEAQVSPIIYCADGKLRHDGKPTSSARHLRDARIHYVAGLPTVDDLVVGFSMLGQSKELMMAGSEALKDTQVESVIYDDHLFEGWSLLVQPPGVSKQLGIEAYLEYAELSPSKTVVVGDGANDLEMLAAADVALSVEGGDPAALALADHVIAHPDEGGWAEVLNFV